jgi:hypothetical protein
MVICDMQMTNHAQIDDEPKRGDTMTSRTKIFSAVAAAAILLATMAVARTVHTHTASASPAMHQTTIGAAPNSAAPAVRRNFACATAVESECDKFDWFPE